MSILTYVLLLSFLIAKPFNKQKYKSFFIGILMLIFLLGWIFLNGIYHDTLTFDQFVKYGTSLGLYVYIFLYGYYNKKILYDFFKVFLFILIINYIFYFVFPEIGVFTESLLGFPIIKGILANRNSIVLFVVPLLLLTKYLNISTKSKGIIYILSALQLFITDSSTAWLVGSITFILLFIKYFNIITLIIITILMNLSVVFLNVNNPLIRFVTINLGGAELDFNGRLFIWKNAIMNLNLEGVLIGFGLNNIELTNHLGGMKGTNGILISGPMNGILSNIYENGLFYTFTIFIIFILICKISPPTIKSYKLLIFLPIIIIASIGENFLAYTNTSSISVIVLLVILQIYNKEAIKNEPKILS